MEAIDRYTPGYGLVAGHLNPRRRGADLPACLRLMLDGGFQGMTTGHATTGAAIWNCYITPSSGLPATPPVASRGFGLVCVWMMGLGQGLAWLCLDGGFRARRVGALTAQSTGGTVQLLYWPSIQADVTGTTGTIGGPVTTTTDGFILTSPTLYVSFNALSAYDSCHSVGGTHYSTIVPITDTAALSTIYGAWSTVPALHVELGIGKRTDVTDEDTSIEWGIGPATAAFAISSLGSNVPYSVYAGQPICQSFIIDQGGVPANGRKDAWWYTSPDSTAARCPTTDPYNPILVLPTEIWGQIDPAWSTCVGDVRGVYDPPKACSPENSMATPTIPAAGVVTTSASPALSVPAATVLATALPQTSTVLVSATGNAGQTETSSAGTNNSPSNNAGNSPATTNTAGGPAPGPSPSSIEPTLDPSTSELPRSSHDSQPSTNDPAPHPASAATGQPQASATPEVPTSVAQDPGNAGSRLISILAGDSTNVPDPPASRVSVVTSQDPGQVIASVLADGASDVRRPAGCWSGRHAVSRTRLVYAPVVHVHWLGRLK